MARREERTCDETGHQAPKLTLEQPTDATLDEATELIGKTWYPDEPAKWGGACEQIELAHHLEHATYVRVAMLCNRFTGIVAVGPTRGANGALLVSASALWYRNHLQSVAPWAPSLFTIWSMDPAARYLRESVGTFWFAEAMAW